MFSVRMDTDSKTYFSVATVVIAIPTGVKIFTWLSHLHNFATSFQTRMVWGIMFIWLFALGGLTGVVLSSASVDLLLHDTYYVVRHFHYVLSMRAVYAIIMAWFHWVPMISGTCYSDVLSRFFQWRLFVRVNLCFMPMHLLRFIGMPRRYITGVAKTCNLNKICTTRALFSFQMLVARLLCIWPGFGKMFYHLMSVRYGDPTMAFRCPSKRHTHVEAPRVLHVPTNVHVHVRSVETWNKKPPR